MKQIGFLVAATTTAWKKFTDAFEHKLTALGWVIGPSGTVTIDYEPQPNGAAGNQSLIKQWADQFVANNVDVIVTAGTEAALACKKATQGNPIPVVFASAGDPAGCGLVASLANPGGNVTGCTNLQVDANLLNRRIAVMQQSLNPKMVGVVGINTVCPVGTAMTNAWQAIPAAGTPVAPLALGQLAPADLLTVAAITAKLTPLQQQGVDVLFACSDPTMSGYGDNLVTAAHNLKMKLMCEFGEFHDLHKADKCYGPSFRNDLFPEAAVLVDQILRARLASTVPVYVPTKFEEVPAPTKFHEVR